MKKIKSDLKNIKQDIGRFYDKTKWHFLTLNGVKLNQNTTEIQWIFKKYFTKEDVVMFYCEVLQDQTVPDISEILPSAIISQREIVDMFGINIENSQKGLYLDEDSKTMPLSSCGI